LISCHNAEDICPIKDGSLKINADMKAAELFHSEHLDSSRRRKKR